MYRGPLRRSFLRGNQPPSLARLHEQPSRPGNTQTTTRLAQLHSFDSTGSRSHVHIDTSPNPLPYRNQRRLSLRRNPTTRKPDPTTTQYQSTHGRQRAPGSSVKPNIKPKMSFEAVMPPYNAGDPTATFLSASCLDFLLIELVPMAYRVTNELEASASSSAQGTSSAEKDVPTTTAPRAAMDEEEERDAVFYRLETLGYRVGQGLVERYVSLCGCDAMLCVVHSLAALHCVPSLPTLPLP